LPFRGTTVCLPRYKSKAKQSKAKQSKAKQSKAKQSVLLIVYIFRVYSVPQTGPLGTLFLVLAAEIHF
jgi:hypothetical protein